MNRYPLWKYAIVITAVILGFLYTMPNFFGVVDAVQISAARSTIKLDIDLARRVELLLNAKQINYTAVRLEASGVNPTVRVRFANEADQLLGLDAINKELNTDPSDPDFTVALNTLSATPDWLGSLGARPMYLGLDLKGGIHFLLQVDMRGAIQKRYDALGNDLRRTLRDKSIRYENINRINEGIELTFPDEVNRDKGLETLRFSNPDMVFSVSPASPLTVSGKLSDAAILQTKETALKQNINTLHNRINELGVAEPVIQQQGSDRIVVELPGITDVAKAKSLIGRTATLEMRLVDSSPGNAAALASGIVPLGLEKFSDATGQSLLLQRQVYLTGENLRDAQAGYTDGNRAAVFLKLDNKGSLIFRDLTRDNVGKRLAILLFEKGKGQIVTAPSINQEIGNGSVQISGSMSINDAQDIALLLRSGSLAAPMEIIEERTVGPSLGADNIKRGFDSTMYGFIAIAIFLSIYYRLMGVFSTIALMVNLLLLIGLLSLLQATLTLPGIAAIALTLGMAIDANVLINERIREELREGATPQQALNLGFERAWGTILDSNITTLIAGVALLAFGSGPIRGFAVVHCLGILTSMFSAVVVARSLSNLWYGRRKKLQGISIGTVWKPTMVKNKTANELKRD